MTFIEFTEKAGHSQLFLLLSHTFSSSVLQCLLPAVCINLLFILNKTKIGWIYLESLVSPQFILLPFYNRIWAFFSTQKSCPQLQHKLVYSEEFPDRRTSGISKCVEMIKVKDVAGCFSRHFSPKEQSQGSLTYKGSNFESLMRSSLVCIWVWESLVCEQSLVQFKAGHAKHPWSPLLQMSAELRGSYNHKNRNSQKNGFSVALCDLQSGWRGWT